MAQTLKFGNGTWATKTGSSLAYNDQNGNYKPLPFNVERDSIATRVNKEGLIEVVGKNKLRIDYTNSAKGVALLEPSRTNLLLQSNQLNTTWFNVSSTETTGHLGVDGTMNAWLLEKTAAQGGIRQNNTTSGVQTLSFYAKANTKNWVKVNNLGNANYHQANFDLKNGVVGSTQFVTSAKIENAGNGWYRCIVTYDTTLVNVDIRVADNDNVLTDTSGSIYLQNFQLEQGSYPTSYIPTSGSTVTRQADVVNGSGNSEVFNDSEGVLFANISALADDSILRTITIGDNSSSNAVSIRIDNANQIVAYVNVGGANQCSITASVPTSLFNKCLIKYKANDFSAWVNGFKIGVDTSGIIFPSGTLNRLNFDIGYGSTSPFYGKAKEISYYDATLTDSELEYLTSYRSLNELVTELNLNTL